MGVYGDIWERMMGYGSVKKHIGVVLIGHGSVTTPKPLMFHNFCFIILCSYNNDLSENETVNLELK